MSTFAIFFYIFTGALSLSYMIFGKKQSKPIAFVSGLGLGVIPLLWFGDVADGSFVCCLYRVAVSCENINQIFRYNAKIIIFIKEPLSKHLKNSTYTLVSSKPLLMSTMRMLLPYKTKSFL